jgi:peptidylprolyl isomerase
MYDISIMNFTPALLLVTAIPLAAQNPATSSPKVPVRPVHHSVAGEACAKLPQLSPKIPALPAGLPCAKPLYIIATRPPATLDYVAPIENAETLRETLRLQEPATISLDYIDIKAGTGAPAAPHKWLTVEYDGYLVDGTKFDSSSEHPGTPFAFNYGQLGGPGSAVAGWETGFGGMKVGAKRRLFIPFELGYGMQPKGKIPPKSMLIFDVTLVAVSDTDPNPRPAAPPARPGVPPATPGTRPAAPTPPPAGAASSPAPATPPPSANPGSAQDVVGKPTATPPANPASDPTKPTATPPPANTPPPSTPQKP